MTTARARGEVTRARVGEIARPDARNGAGTPEADGGGTPDVDGAGTPDVDGAGTPDVDGIGTPEADASAELNGAGAPEVDATGTRYAGLATRTLAFALDAAVINVVGWAVAAIITLGLSLLAVPDEVRTVLIAIGAVAALLWTIGYFVFFWSASGQTPGNRVLGIRVEDGAGGGPIRPRRALLRLLALLLSALPLCAGFLLILVDDRRRALHDRIARTTVSYALPGAAAPRRARRAAGARGRG